MFSPIYIDKGYGVKVTFINRRGNIMKSKSLVQERLEASTNRLQILTREAENSRMPALELSRGLRQVGTYLESMQKLVKTDTNVKFQMQINQKLEIGMNRLTHVIGRLEGDGITGNILAENLSQVNRALESVQEFVDLEIQDIA